PFMTLIESPTLLDVASMLHTIRRSDSHGYGKYSANHGKFSTSFLAVAIGYPRFSVLDMLRQANNGKNLLPENPQFDSLQESVVLQGNDIEDLANKLSEAFTAYVQALG
ncbi:MAG: type I-D CRISPR-associated protein Csc2, partial [Chloroflexi bacterium]|nr:type I-D CRISPR-associated protein Csc2 [Chloroflexota bacterium]